jgi:hypothetical protein
MSEGRPFTSNPGTGALTEFAARVLRRELAQPERSR